MRSEEEMIAYALEVTPSLLPYIPELLADLEELGSDAGLVVDVLRELDPPRGSRVIDLGCGKGATAIKIASELGHHVLGIDLFEPFVDACNESAGAADVAALCEFRQGDILKLVDVVESADAVIFAALGDVLGPLDKTVGVIRRFAKPGGLVLVSDGYIRGGASGDFPCFENYVGHEESIRRLTSCGDCLIREVAEPEAPEGDGGVVESRLIRARAERIAARHPELREELLVYAEEQAAEYLFLRESFVGTLWVLRRSEDAVGKRL
jgi:SAM-dependent methyltransferase